MASSAVGDPARVAEALHLLRQHPRRLVRALVSSPNFQLRDALFEVAFAGKPAWSLAEVHATVAELEGLDLRVDAWLRQRAGDPEPAP